MNVTPANLLPLLAVLVLLMPSCSSNHHTISQPQIDRGDLSPDGYLFSAYRQGKKDAEAEIAAGKLAMEVSGSPFPSADLYAEELKSKYEIDYRPVAACSVGPVIRGHLKGFNEVMIPEIERRYGKDVFDKARVAAQNKSNQNG